MKSKNSKTVLERYAVEKTPYDHDMIERKIRRGIRGRRFTVIERCAVTK